jgi:phage terminase large subunit GpA-like protein
MAPPPTQTVSEWADSERILSPEASAEPGKWNTHRAEYQRGIMDAVGDEAVAEVVIYKAAQTGCTEIINNVLGFHIDRDPCPVLVVQPSIDMAAVWSKDRLSPMLRDTPSLIGKVHEAKSRDSNNTIRQKAFPGGRLAVIGANAPAGLASRPIRLVLADEVDRYPVSAGSEGDPLALARKRQMTFWNRKTVIGSTPTLKNFSTIEREWQGSDQRRYFVPCHACDHRQTLRWENVRWDKAPTGEHRADTAHYVCEACGAIWTDADRWEAVQKGRWKATAANTGVAGFHVPGFLSSWLTLQDIVRDFLAARHDPQLLQVFVNTVLGEPWEERGETVDAAGFMARREIYSADSVPAGVRIITAGIDVQNDRLEVQIIGWGTREESWVLDYEIIYGDPAQDSIWQDLDEYLLHSYLLEDGRELKVRGACIDTGGHHANQVFNFCKLRRGRSIFATKGGPGPRPVWPKRSSFQKRARQREFWLIGVDTAKDAIYGRLKISEPKPGYVHFPVSDIINQNYFDQLTSEQAMTRYREGKPYRVWVLPPKRRNEALDTFVLALAARLALPIRLDVGPPPRPEQHTTAQPAPSPYPPPPPAAPPRPGAPIARKALRRVLRSPYMSR